MKFRYIENDKGKPILLLHGAVAVTYKNNMRVEKPVLCIEAGSWKEACAKIKGETLPPPPKKAIDLIHEAINDCYSRMLHPKCILCRFDFYDQLVLELNNLTMGWVETDKPAEIFGIRLVCTPDVAKNVNKFEVIA